LNIIWDFSTVSIKENRFFLNQPELTLTLPWAVRYYPWPFCRFPAIEILNL